ncbi:hypothetical protein ACFOWU_03755 [Epilithonimonas zeae]|uniref:Uncharacterized protein n=1 Tax=Epilithonimonas zeae TaxID=1416779 RepID=A0A1N6ERA9_9FLAO|nr:hypothetical protein [Epilithonimonas zeae]SIN85463.1 hypothetical protein SAMN05444409_0796 [Epilithonimonas zeae]
MKKIILKIYLVLSILLVSDGVLYYFWKISFAGYYSDVILFWLWILTSFSVIVLFWKKLLAKLLLGTLIVALILSILPMMLPFYTIFFAMTPFGSRMQKDLNQNYRAQIVGYSMMRRPWLEIIEKKGIFEQQIIQCTDQDVFKNEVDLRIGSAKDIRFDSETDNTLTLVLFYGGPNYKVTFDKKTGKVKAIETH